MNDIMKIIQALEDSNILLKGVTEAIKNETKEVKQMKHLRSKLVRRRVSRKRSCETWFWE